MTGEPPDNVVPIDGHAARRRWMEQALDAAGFVATEYFLERKLRGRGWIADPELGFSVALRRLRMLIDSQSDQWLRRRQHHDGRHEFMVEAGATMWIVILDRRLHRIINAYPSDWQ